MLERVTFTGIDSSVMFGHLAELTDEFSWVEWGILAGSQTGQPRHEQIFPKPEIIRELRRVFPADRIALHLCGTWARQAAGIEEPTQDLYDLCGGFGRIQVNLNGQTDSRERIGDPEREQLVWFAERPFFGKVILQHRESWESVPIHHEQIEYLFDLSEGNGANTISQWPPPPPWPASPLKRVGYAGGLDPYRIHEALLFARRHPEAPMWFDMQGRIRTGGYFDLYKVRAVCEAVRG